MISKPLITIIIPTFRRAHLLKRAVKCVMKQTYSQVKICVYDNASGDDTSQVMDDLCKQDDRIHYFCHSENIGMMANYAYGLSKVDSPFFCFFSDDDYVFPWFYETAMNAFSNYPEAGFSACGVIAITPEGKFIGDPMIFWNREGYYEKGDGAFSMVDLPTKFPIPTGIVFNYQIVRQVHPDFSQEMQLMWDPDYLLHIALQFPIVVSKRVCGIFVSHDEGYSSGFYKKIKESPILLEDYFKVTKKMYQRIQENALISEESKKVILDRLIKMVRKEAIGYLQRFTAIKKFKGAFYAVKFFQQYFIKDRSMKLMLVPSAIYAYVPFIRFFMRCAFKIFRKFNNRTNLLNHKAKENEQLIKAFLSIH